MLSSDASCPARFVSILGRPTRLIQGLEVPVQDVEIDGGEQLFHEIETLQEHGVSAVS